MINILKPGSFALRKRERSQICDWQKTSLHHHHQDINVGRCAAVYMQIAVTLSVAFKACKAGPCNAPLPFSWIPDATTSSNPHPTHPILFSYFLLLNFTILYLFSFLPVPGVQSLASTAELLLRWLRFFPRVSPCYISPRVLCLSNQIESSLYAHYLPLPNSLASLCSGWSVGGASKCLWLPLRRVHSLQDCPPEEHAGLP